MRVFKSERARLMIKRLLMILEGCDTVEEAREKINVLLEEED